MNFFTVILVQPLANGLIIFYNILGSNLGLAIIGFSLFLRILLNPLAKPQMESMKKMKEYAPQIEKLKKKYKNDKTKLMKAQADFYKQKGINPYGGCLPMILQFAILIALFQVFSRALTPGNLTNFNNLLYGFLKFPEGVTINTHFLYLDLVKPDVIKLAFLPFGLPGPLLIASAVAQMLSAKIMTPYVELKKKIVKKTPEKSDDFAVAFQSSSVYTFPLMTLLIGVGFPSGLALYWFLFSAYQAYQQYRSSGWGGATPWIKALGLLKLTSNDQKDK